MTLLLRFVVLLCLLLLSNIGFTQSLTKRLNESGTVDWSRYVVMTSGSSSSLSADSNAQERIAAIEAAKAAAVENLFKAVQNLQVDANMLINNAIERHIITVSELKEILQHYTIVDTRSMSDLSVEVDVELPITNNLLPLFLPKPNGRGELRVSSEPLCPTCFQPWPSLRTVPEHVHLIVPTEGFTTNKGTPYTGLVIDVRGLNFSPALKIRLLNSKNEVVYGPGYVDGETATNIGMVDYRNDLRTILKNSRSGVDPLIIRAVDIQGKLNSDIVITSNDAILIHAAAKIRNFLKECKVVILVG